jgi:DNA-binding NarL/FixJ family response regulator
MHDPDPGPVEPLRILVVDADDRVRESLTGLLGIGPRVVVVGDAGHAGAALALAGSAAPDVVVLDPRLPELDGGLAFVNGLRAIAPRVRVLVMTCTDGEEHSLFEGRVDGFIRKTFRPSDLVAAIEAAGRTPV